MDDEQQQI